MNDDNFASISHHIHSEICDILRAGLSCLWLEVGVSRKAYDKTKYFASILPSAGGRRLREWLDEPETKGRVE